MRLSLNTLLVVRILFCPAITIAPRVQIVSLMRGFFGAWPEQPFRVSRDGDSAKPLR
jgi:hypothetical protein